MKTIILTTTKQGLFHLTSAGRRRWSLSGPHFTKRGINHFTYDLRSGRICATSNDAWFGSVITWWPNLGQNGNRRNAIRWWIRTSRQEFVSARTRKSFLRRAKR